MVASPHGLDGSFHVAQANALLLANAEAVVIGGAERRITRRAGHERRMILGVEGCADRDAAVALRGLELLVDRSAAPELEPDEWWAEDLEGCAVSDGPTPVGIVTRLMALPSCEVLQVRSDDGRELLVPLVGDAVRSVDIERREIDVDLSFLGE